MDYIIEDFLRGMIKGVLYTICFVDKVKENMDKKHAEKMEAEKRERPEYKIKQQAMIDKLREEYLELHPMEHTDIIGMRVHDYEISYKECPSGKLIEFITGTDECFYLCEEDLSEFSFNCYMCPDPVEDVAEALSLYIPRFADGEKTIFSTEEYGTKFYGLYDCLCEKISFSQEYIESFIDPAAVDALPPNQQERLKQVISAWNTKGLLQLVGREAYEPWKQRMKELSNSISDRMIRQMIFLTLCD